MLVTSGIDDEIEVWQPGEGHHLGEIPTRRDEDTDDDETADFEDDVWALIERGFEFQRLANRGRFNRKTTKTAVSLGTISTKIRTTRRSRPSPSRGTTTARRDTPRATAKERETAGIRCSAWNGTRARTPPPPRTRALAAEEEERAGSRGRHGGGTQDASGDENEGEDEGAAGGEKGRGGGRRDERGHAGTGR